MGLEAYYCDDDYGSIIEFTLRKLMIEIRLINSIYLSLLPC